MVLPISIVRCSRLLFAMGILANLVGCYLDQTPTKTQSSESSGQTLRTIADGSNLPSVAREAGQILTPENSSQVPTEEGNELGTKNVSSITLPVQNATEPGHELEVKPKVAPNPPLHLDEILQRIDIRKFPFMEGNSRNGSGVEHYGFSAAVSQSFTVDNVMRYLDKLLVDAGCVGGTDPELEYRVETGAGRMYFHGDLMINASCGTSRGSAGPDINANIHVLGNVDLRTLPTPPDTRIALSKPDSLKLLSSVEILELRKYYSNALREMGWIEYRENIPGIKIPVENQIPHQRFLKNAVYLSFYFRESSEEDKSKGRFVATVGAGILDYEPTLPIDAKSVSLGLRNPMTMSFESKLSPHDLRVFYDQAFGAQGYRFDQSPTETEANDFKINYSHPEKISWTIEAKRLHKTTIVVVNQIPTARKD